MSGRNITSYLKIRAIKDIVSTISEDEVTAKHQINMHIINLKKKYEKEKKVRIKKCFKQLINSLENLK